MISKKVIALAAVPILSVAFYIHFFGLNIPFWDQWTFVSYLMLEDQGRLTFEPLFALHNEHRPFFPRLIWLWLANLTHYNIKAELWTNLLIAISGFIFFVRCAFQTWERNKLNAPAFAIPLLSLMIFNLGHRESWIQGFQTIMFLGMACVVVGILLLAKGDTISIAAAALLGFVANFSMVNGLFYWPLGLVLLLLNETSHARIIKSAAWIVFSFIVIGFFLNGWGTSSQINLQYLFTHPLEWALWILNFLGAPIFAFWYIAWVFGVLSLVLYSVILAQTIRSGQWKPMLPYLAIAVFILVTTLTISLGRMEYGLRQSTVSRYLTMSVWYWASLLALLPFARFKLLRMGFVYMLLTASLAALSFAGGWVGYIRLYLRILPAYQSVISGRTISSEDLAQIHFDPAIAGPQIEFLSRNKLSAWKVQGNDNK